MFASITMGSDARDLVTLINEVVSISITQKKSILYTNKIRSALHSNLEFTILSKIVSES